MVGNSGSEVEVVIQQVRLSKSGETPVLLIQIRFPHFGSQEAWRAWLKEQSHHDLVVTIVSHIFPAIAFPRHLH